MNEQEIKKLEEQLEKLGKSIDSKLEDFSKKAKDASAEEMKSLKADFNANVKSTLEKEIEVYNKKAAKLQDQVDELETKLQRVGPFTNGLNKKTFKEAIEAELVAFKGDGSLKDKIHKSKGAELMLKIDDMTGANTLTGAVVPPDQQVGIIYDPDRREHIRDLISVGSTDSSSVTFVYEGSYNDSTDTTTEGAEYKQSDTNLAVATATVRKITAYVIVSEELLEDVAGLTSYLSAKLPSKLKVKEDQQILYGANTGTQLNGICTQATAYVDALADADISEIDVLVDACRQVRVNEYQATAILIHPTDATKIKLTKDDNGNYIHPWIFMPNGQITLDGVPVFVTTAITASSFLVGDFKLGCQVFDRKQAALEFSYQNEDNFVKGMVTVRISERITLAVYRAKCFCYGTFTYALAAGSL
jgi:HK97 family phage major capsid protein